MESTKKTFTLNGPALSIRNLVLVVIFMIMVTTVCQAQDTAVIERVCNGANMPNLNYQQAAVQALSDVINNAFWATYKWRKSVQTINGKTSYAVAACALYLNQAQCTSCLYAGFDNLGDCRTRSGATSYAKGARVTLVDCRLRWEIYDFNWKTFVTSGSDDELEHATEGERVIVTAGR